MRREAHTGQSTRVDLQIRESPPLRPPRRAPLDWKAILASVHRRRASKGTGIVVIDMGSCTVSVGLGGLDAAAAATAAAAPSAASAGGSSTNPRPAVAEPLSIFPAIALNDLVGDEIGSDSVKLRGINPVSSISMPILHANETGEFGFCRSIWSYALARVPTEAFAGRPTATDGQARSNDKKEQRQRDKRRRESDEGVQVAAAVTAASSAVSPAAACSPSPSCPFAPSPSPSPDDSEFQGGTVFVCDQLLGSRLELANKRAKVARILFSLLPDSASASASGSPASASAGKFRVAFCNESLLSLLHSGKSTGVALHVGFSRSTCAIFVGGRLQNLHALPTRMVGGHMHSRIMLQALFSRRQFQPAVADMFAVIPMLKRACGVSLDSAADTRKPREETHCSLEIAGQRLVLGHERFTSSDVFFLYGFPAMVVEALQSAPTWPVWTERKAAAKARATNAAAETADAATGNENHATAAAMEDAASTAAASSPSSTSDSAAVAAPSLFDPDPDAVPDDPHTLLACLMQSIVLSGRSTTLRGFGARFERDLNSILKASTPARVHDNPTWMGGAVLSALSGFAQLVLTREELS